MAVSLPWKKGNKNNLGQGQISLSREAQYLAKRSRAQEGQEDTPQKSGILKNSPPGWSSDRPRVEISGEKSKYILAIKHNKNSTQNSDFALFYVSEASYSVSQHPSIWRIFLTKTFQFSFHKEMGKISKIGKLCSWTPSNHYLSWSFIHSWIRTISKFLENDARSSSFFCKLSHENDQVKRGFGQWFLKVRLLAADSTEFSGSHSERH